MNKLGFWIALGICAAAIGQPARAHHSFAMFDMTKMVELKDATVVKLAWGNPHVFIVVNAAGQTYTLECNSPSNLTGMGWKYNSLKAGDKITVTIHPLRNGKPGGSLKKVKLPNGKTLEG
jgi:hypothetical protein